MESTDGPHANLVFLFRVVLIWPAQARLILNLRVPKSFQDNFSDLHLASSLISKNDDLDDKKF